jgi:hypothetical protein
MPQSREDYHQIRTFHGVVLKIYQMTPPPPSGTRFASLAQNLASPQSVAEIAQCRRCGLQTFDRRFKP